MKRVTNLKLSSGEFLICFLLIKHHFVCLLVKCCPSKTVTPHTFDTQKHLLDELEAFLDLLPATPSVSTRSRHVCVF